MCGTGVWSLGTPSFTRALPSEDGTEFVFTLFLQPDTPSGVIAEQARNPEGALKVLKSLCEAPAHSELLICVKCRASWRAGWTVQSPRSGHGY